MVSVIDGSVWRVFSRSMGGDVRLESILRLGNCLDVKGPGDWTIGEPTVVECNSGVEG